MSTPKRIIFIGQASKAAELITQARFMGFEIEAVEDIVQDNLPRGLRNNNPGNIRINSRNNWKGKVPVDKNTDGDFEQFEDPKYGVRALAVLLLNYEKKGINTIQKIIGRYAPATENHTHKYIEFVCQKSGFDWKEKIHLNERNLKTLMRYIIWYENGVDWLTDERFEEGYQLV